MNKVYKRFRRFIESQATKDDPLAALFKRLWWRIRWACTSQPFSFPFRKDLVILIPKTGPGAGIFYQGSSEPDTTEFLNRFLRPGMVVLDIGAHIGEYTLLAAEKVGEHGQVHSFEPSPVIYPVLEKNVQINGFTNVFLNQLAVSNKDGELEFEISSEPSTSSIRNLVGTKVDSKLTYVKTVSLDRYCSDLKRKPDLIKIDVEGAEKYVLQSAHNILKLPLSDSPTLVLEYAPQNYARFNYQPSEILELLAFYGYQALLYLGGSRIDPFVSNSDLPDIVNIIATKQLSYLLHLLRQEDTIND